MQQQLLEGITLVLIDNDKDTHATYTPVLKAHGCSVHAAYNGYDGLKLIKEKRPHVVLLEVILSGKIDGFELLETLKNDHELKDIPVIFYTDLEHPEDEERGCELGAFHYLVKAKHTLQQLIDTIKSAKKMV